MLSDYVNHSGGAIGSDSEWDDIGKIYGMVTNKHYYVNKCNTPRGNTPISVEDSMLNDNLLIEANKKYIHRRFPTSNYYVNTLLRRNIFQIINSESTFAIGTITDGILNGGTAWAVYVGVLLGHDTYVYEQNKCQWMVWDWRKDQFVEFYETPVLTKHFAGIGTREINENGKAAIEAVYQETLRRNNEG